MCHICIWEQRPEDTMECTIPVIAKVTVKRVDYFLSKDAIDVRLHCYHVTQAQGCDGTTNWS